MDSKLRTLAITCAVLMILSVLGTVLLINIRDTKKKNEIKAQSQTAEAATGERDLSDPSYYEYLRDESFFDKELSEYEKLVMNSDRRLSILATSVERDLRVQILDDNGRLAKGNDLFITLNGVEYKDLDRDGIIYVGDLKSGDYQVALKETEGYKVPSNPVNIHVKDNVEFLPIEDISLLLKTEDDIDALKEDSEQAVSADDTDDSENSSVISAEGSRAFGIDVSKWNGNIDWVKVKNAGVDFAIIRCGYRGSSTGALIEDPYFRANFAGARAAGVNIGLYFFTQAVNAVEAVEEASAVLALNAGAALDYPIFIDSEGAGGRGRADRLDATTRTEVCRAFCETIENAGYRAGVYASRSWFYNNLDTTVLDPYITWLAEYREAPLYKGKYHMWQYTDKGNIDGIITHVDFNISYGGMG